MTYTFLKQFAFGRKYENLLDEAFADRFVIKASTRAQERQGIDRIFTERSSGSTYTIQYKADKTAARTGNAFVETVSVDTQKKPGWALTCQADFIIYYVVDVGPAYILKPKDIKGRLARWRNQYGERRIPNKGYNTIGLIVPLREFENLAVATVNI
jgi:hypothetical protein